MLYLRGYLLLLVTIGIGLHITYLMKFASCQMQVAAISSAMHLLCELVYPKTKSSKHVNRGISFCTARGNLNISRRIASYALITKSFKIGLFLCCSSSLKCDLVSKV